MASPSKRETIEALISFYNTGDLKEYDRFNILWVQDTGQHGGFRERLFTEVYGDPLASWEAMVNFKDMDATVAQKSSAPMHSGLKTTAHTEKYRKRR